MSTRDVQGNLHDRAGKFATKTNSRPAESLSPAPEAPAIILFDVADPSGGFDVAVDAPTGRYYLRGGHPHREDGPAYEGLDGTQEWRVDGELHRDGAPAVIHDDGSEEFWEHGHLLSA
ncbi:hypothetical protein [Microbacterium gorillae]|uniref:hypothetical protein n=1 Tax=Microbacterium gorillae TaxID=1231063 RepID=UPI003D95A2D1